MYTLSMSWLFRALALTMMLALGFASQATCLMPEQPATQSEPDCCKQMASDCNGTNTSMACCQMVVRTDPAITRANAHDLIQRFNAENAVDLSTSFTLNDFRERVSRSDHAPPYDSGVSSPVLRI